METANENFNSPNHTIVWLFHRRSNIILLILTILLFLSSCSGDKLDFDSGEDAVKVYQDYLMSVKNIKSSNTNDFYKELQTWKETTDTVYHFLKKDSLLFKRQDLSSRFMLIHDSIRYEMLRLTETWRYSYAEVLKIKEQASAFHEDTDLQNAVNEARPFFESLDTISLSKQDCKTVLSQYRNFLETAKRQGIHNKEAMLRFIMQEDYHFRSFLSHLYELENEPLTDITTNTETICNGIFIAARNKEIKARDAVVYMSMRTVRRLLQNSSVCLSDIKRHPLKSKVQSNAYVWMILQPFISIDQFSIATLTPQDRSNFNQISAQLPKVKRIAETLDIDQRTLNYLLPQQLLKMYILTL